MSVYKRQTRHATMARRASAGGWPWCSAMMEKRSESTTELLSMVMYDAGKVRRHRFEAQQLHAPTGGCHRGEPSVACR